MTVDGDPADAAQLLALIDVVWDLIRDGAVGESVSWGELHDALVVAVENVAAQR